MLQVHDFRETRVYQEGVEDGIAIVKMAAEKKSAEEMAAILKLDVEYVRKVLAKISERN